MAAHNTLGKTGEDAAVAYLERNGYTINHRNWRKNRLELDIVAVKDGLLIVVEVKPVVIQSTSNRKMLLTGRKYAIL